MLEKIKTFLKKNWGWMLLLVAAIIIAIFSIQAGGLIGLFTLIFWGSNAAIKATEDEKIKKKLEEIKNKDNEYNSLTDIEKKKFEELKRVEDIVAHLDNDELADYGNKRPRRKIR